ncbi:hypothetical protein [Streptomyces sp. NBC_00572]|uniref:hypothetical protein n=1 Tax=Streptomyces sp. NBC_00572 TaxID=2903664 RepID=UPI002252E6B9|nr:hypothetical protein [Streptomyces sp. NBC_00572]MCX4987090.1 hypothetical protein [Streptomyces sp. NBC_00572]
MGTTPGQQPPPPGGSWGAVPPQPPKKRSRTCLVVSLVLGGLVLVTVIAVIALVATVEDPSRDGPTGPAGDVKITACQVDAGTKWPHADLDVTNRSSKPSDYIISVEFVGASGERLTESNAVVSHLAPGQLANERAQSLTQVDEAVTCRITDVTRVAS